MSNDSAPLVSVILPAYNASAVLRQSVDSILSQTYRNFELIIIDDGSSDNTWEVIQRNKDPRIFAKRLSENIGLINVLNYALDLVHGKYIARMDADDIALPGKLEKQIAFLESNAEYGACGTAIYNFNENTSSYMRYPVEHDEIVTNLSLFERNICHPTVVIRTDIIRKHNIRYRDEYVHAEDYMLWIDIARHSKLYNLRKAYLKYHRHNNQVSSRYYPEQIETSKIIVTERLLDFYQPEPTQAEMASHLKFLIHRTDLVEQYADVNEMKSWRDKLLSYNARHKRFQPRVFRKVVNFKYLRCCLYYRFSWKEKFSAFSRFILSDPAFGLIYLVELMYLFAYYRLRNGGT